MKTLNVKLTDAGAGTIMHNCRLANPLDPFVKAIKEISSKGKNKTDADYAEMARLEFEGGIYHAADVGPYIPGPNVHAMIGDGAKQRRRGPAVKRGVIVPDLRLPLQYEGPKDVNDLFAQKFYDQRMLSLPGQGTVLRTRPYFKGWTLDVTLFYDEEQIKEAAELLDFLRLAGKYIGLGDGRPAYGRFEVEEVAEKAKRRAG